MTMLLLLLAAAAPAAVAADAVKGLEGQVSAWNRGDLDAALDAYCPSPQLTWVSRSGVSHGFADFAEGMRKDFADRVSMGRYEAEILDSRAAGPRSALVTMRWSITRDGKRLMGGVSTQLWQPCKGRLRIVLEHAS